MIRLHQFKRQWGIANPSPFCMKVETYLRMTGLPYEVIEEASPLNAPKKKLPYIDDGEKVIPDSGFIIDYLKASYGNPLDGGLSRAQQADAHLLRRLCEESLLWPVVYSRWIDDRGWS
ncbi:MAG: Tom37 metaxin N-terminal-like domain-containing protein, partial [Gammaproteobacteria bacterium]